MLEDVLHTDNDRIVHLSGAHHAMSHLSYHRNTLAHWFVADAVVFAGVLLAPVVIADPVTAEQTFCIRQGELQVHVISLDNCVLMYAEC